MANRNQDRFGEKNPNSKMTLEMVAEVREMFKRGISVTDIAEHFQISHPQVSKIVRNQSWVAKT